MNFFIDKIINNMNNNEIMENLEKLSESMNESNKKLEELHKSIIKNHTHHNNKDNNMNKAKNNAEIVKNNTNETKNNTEISNEELFKNIFGGMTNIFSNYNIVYDENLYDEFQNIKHNNHIDLL